ncbi:MAG: YajQ family cyclic di-GMP-binding protein [Gammaproteobacteria bacterium]|nr:YajQ family cyclic di-GMP-binding protein [Gammaproteobacteria bacterium]
MPSFDVVSEVDMHEITNAVDQTNREVATRFDFKGSDARVEMVEGGLSLEGENEFQLDQMMSILETKLAKRKVDINALDPGEVQESNRRARRPITLRQGIDKELARRIVKQVKESKLKVQASVQGEQVRVTGKKRDELQQIIALLKEQKFDQPLQFINFRD